MCFSCCSCFLTIVNVTNVHCHRVFFTSLLMNFSRKRKIPLFSSEDCLDLPKKFVDGTNQCVIEKYKRGDVNFGLFGFKGGRFEPHKARKRTASSGHVVLFFALMEFQGKG